MDETSGARGRNHGGRNHGLEALVIVTLIKNRQLLRFTRAAATACPPTFPHDPHVPHAPLPAPQASPSPPAPPGEPPHFPNTHARTHARTHTQLDVNSMLARLPALHPRAATPSVWSPHRSRPSQPSQPGVRSRVAEPRPRTPLHRLYTAFTPPLHRSSHRQACTGIPR